MNVRECRQCHQMVDFDEPWCDHETMEESAWRDIQSRRDAAMIDTIMDDAVERAVKELGFAAGKALSDKIKKDFE
jgi:hypothetical protein